MAQGKISKKQQEILEYIKSQILQRGFPPAVREICEAVGLKSTSSVHSHLETLEKNGYIRRDPTKPRAIEILDDDFNLVRREMVSVPIIGRVAAGQPILAEENIVDYFPFPAERMPNRQTFLLKVKGESMINAGILDGDYVLVEEAKTASFMGRFSLLFLIFCAGLRLCFYAAAVPFAVTVFCSGSPPRWRPSNVHPAERCTGQCSPPG